MHRRIVSLLVCDMERQTPKATRELLLKPLLTAQILAPNQRLLCQIRFLPSHPAIAFISSDQPNAAQEAAIIDQRQHIITKATMKTNTVYALLALPTAASALSSIPADPFFKNRRALDTADGTTLARQGNANEPTAPVLDSAPWRVALDIGREPLAQMPFDWARSGCRMPLVIPSDFSNISSTNSTTSNLFVPRSETVSFTGPDGAVVKPIQGRKWKLSKDSKELTFSFVLPEELRRRDVSIEAGTELSLSGRLYTQAELDHLNQEFYQAREEVWQLGGELSDIFDRQGAPKKWNQETSRWEKRYANDDPLKIARKQLSYWGAKAKQGQKLKQRPDVNNLSDRGSLPGVEGGVFIAKGGIVRAGPNGAVCGTWSMQPITSAVASYRGS